MITKLYRKTIPESTRDTIYDAFLGNILMLLRNFKIAAKSKTKYLFRPFIAKSEENELYAFLGRYGLTPYVFKQSIAYRKWTPSCFFDEEKNLHYVVHNERKLYFPEEYKVRRIKELYKSIVIEQDEYSPHRYVDNYDTLKNKTLLDIGCAEGIFSLDVIDRVKHVYLFECEEKWMGPLLATFEPWKDKVTIVKKYIGGNDEGNFMTIDSFLKDKPVNNLFLKMDIEGFEQDALAGAKDTLQNTPDIYCSVCTYHKDEDAVQIAKILDYYKFQWELTEGYLFFDNKFRKAMIRGKKVSKEA